jgi:hypothetical protein
MSLNSDSNSFKNEINEALDEKVGPLLLKMAKMLKEANDSVKQFEIHHSIVNSRLEDIFNIQTEMNTKLSNLDQFSSNFEKLDRNLAKFLHKSLQDSKKLQEQIESIVKEQKVLINVKEEVSAKDELIVKEEILEKIIEPSKEIKEIKEIINEQDKEEIKNLIAEFSKKDIYSSEAIRLIEETRDKLLFEREDEVPYRAFAAKIFRELLAISKQEKDYRTISTQAANDIKKHLNYLLDHI